MAFDSDRAKVLRVAGAASAAAPYVRRILSDDELRGDLRGLIVAGRHLYEGLTTDGVSKLLDDDARKDIDRMVAALQDASERAVRPQRRSHWGSWLDRGHAHRRRHRRVARSARARASRCCALWA